MAFLKKLTHLICCKSPVWLPYTCSQPVSKAQRQQWWTKTLKKSGKKCHQPQNGTGNNSWKYKRKKPLFLQIILHIWACGCIWHSLDYKKKERRKIIKKKEEKNEKHLRGVIAFIHISLLPNENVAVAQEIITHSFLHWFKAAATHHQFMEDH